MWLIPGRPLSQEINDVPSLDDPNENLPRKSHGRTRDPLGLPTGTTGALSELIVSADLLRRGYEVFRAVSPSCSCDLIVQRGETKIRIEVRTGSISSANGRWTCAVHKGERHRFDVLAICVIDVGIAYVPAIDGEAIIVPIAKSVFENTVAL